MRRDRNHSLTARNADRYALYEQSVQAPQAEVEFIDRIFRRARGRPPLSLREDFCGTALLCADWVKSHPERTAVGLDIDERPLAYGGRRHLRPLGEAAKRVRLLRRDVLDGAGEPADVVVAFNFSYCVLQSRRELLRYFAAVRSGLAPGGVLLLDVYGGPDAQTELVETKRMRGFSYVWDQRPYDAISGHARRYIHFRFRDGSELKRAFAYDWRIWTLPELRDALLETGFDRIEVYWEGSDARGHGNGVFRKVRAAENEQAWIAYVAAWHDTPPTSTVARRRRSPTP